MCIRDSVYPAGGQQGSTVQVTIGGQFLVDVTAAYVSGTGVRAVVLPSEPLLTGKQAAQMRARLRQLREKQPDAEAWKEIREIRRKLAAYEGSKVTPAIGETVAVQIVIAPDATPGNREIRLGTLTGLTNPLVFQIGQLPESREPDPPPDDDWVEIQKSVVNRVSRLAPDRASRPPAPVTLPTTINGRLFPGEVDRFQFRARRGQKLVVCASARELLPYLADTVPGWLRLDVALFNSQGQEVTCTEELPTKVDPVRRYEIPADGEYVLEIKDALYRGRADFVYRVRVGELPLPTDVFPLRPVAAENLPEILASPSGPQAVTLPVIINGRINRPGDTAVFQFEARAGEAIVAEVMARRLDSPLDSVLALTDANGRLLAHNDDYEDKGFGMLTHHADSYLSYTLPASGTYFVRLADAQQRGGPAYSYRLRLSPPQPDFALRVVPATINVRANATVPVTVYALRKDGFSGAIAVELKDAPPGFILSGGLIPANQDKTQCTLTAPATPPETPIRLQFEGRATIQGKTVCRPAVPAQDMTQAFSYRHLVPFTELLVAVSGHLAPDSPAKILSPLPIKIPAGGATQVRFRVPRYSAFDTAQIKLLNPPEGIAIEDVSWLTEGLEIVIGSDGSKVKPDVQGNLIATFVAKDPTPPGAPRINPKRVPLGSLPAIPYEVVKAGGRGQTSP
ncbi:MAG: PPC domain-containing protein, partial [Verrucomicrobiae bacterium]|nr:PPC domain-containing protein [Verrucomicrobiae bacterium]